jgi:hypothetical protein
MNSLPIAGLPIAGLPIGVRDYPQITQISHHGC